ncbi:MAG TPA: D-alanyl-D-alanine carboxypeptidase/D-alanyl-D-alanine-endopeptidase [Vicinamibacterales bacterium]|nr:D-alanyl-D-alanine carboxypeptidase/D-alanyl-D-alanine-endopeptidase [Vicinamibacterales bacterium]
MRPGRRAPVALAAIAVLAGCAARTAPAVRPSDAVRQLRSDLTRVFAGPVASRASWAVDIRSLDRQEVLFQLASDRLVMPASNMKIVTLAAAAELLGWDYRFETSLETDAPVEQGILQGDLIVRGNGDPTINSRNSRADAVLEAWTSALRQEGISEVRGRIVGDDQAFDDEWLGAGWAWDYLQYGYAAPVGALQFDENLAQLTVTPGAASGDPPGVGLSPGAGLAVRNLAVTTLEGSIETLDYRRRLDLPVLEITGAIPAGSPPVVRSVAVVNPTVFFVESLRQALIERGIAVSGPAVDLDDVAAERLGLQAPRRVLVTVASPPLREIGTVLMKMSQNLYGETLVKAVGAAEGGMGTLSGGRARIQALLENWSVGRDECVLADGSGLSRYNYVTARALTTILARMYRDERHRDAFLSTLAVAGRDGTIATRFRGTRAENNAVVKTGSIANVRALSGFVRTRDGEAVVFSIVANDFVLPAATVNSLADVAVETLANFSRR